jgi:hypothetical protein
MSFTSFNDPSEIKWKHHPAVENRCVTLVIRAGKLAYTKTSSVSSSAVYDAESLGAGLSGHEKKFRIA